MSNKEIKGALTYQDYSNLIINKRIFSYKKIPATCIQPASLDLRLDKKAYEISSSFLATESRVEERLKNFKLKTINLSKGYLFKKNITYLVELQEELNLNKYYFGKCNPKSSTGRLDIFCRTITDYNSEYEIIKNGYKGKIYLEITSKTFNIIFKEGDILNQLRLRFNKIVYLNDDRIRILSKKTPILFNKYNKIIKPDIDNGVKISANISDNKNYIAYRAKKNSPDLIFNKYRYYSIKDFWEPIKNLKNNSITIKTNEFYILKSKEKIKILPELAAEMVPYDTNFGEFRVHYAGFFDPGFGCENNGSHAVLEIKTYEVPFEVEHGQNIARLLFEKLAHIPKKIYGKEIKSNYQNQGLALSKHFRIKE